MKIDILERALARDAGPLIAAGLALVAPTGRALFLKRSGAKRYNGNTWCMPGGKCEGGETPMHAALRETEEETGWTRSGQAAMPRQVCEARFYDTLYITFRLDIDDEFVPDLSDGEHTDYKWCPLDQPPQPLHPGLPGVLPRVAQDEDFRASRENVAKEARETLAHKLAAQDAEFREEDHPRDHGKFSEKAGGGGDNPYEPGSESAKHWEAGVAAGKAGKKPHGAQKMAFWKGYESAKGQGKSAGSSPAGPEKKEAPPPAASKQEKKEETPAAESEKEAAAATRSMDARDRAAFSSYTGQNFRYANAIARGNRDSLGRLQKEAGDKLKADLDRAWETVPPTEHEETLYRGVHTVKAMMDIDPAHPEEMIGKSFEDGGWTSTSSSYGKAQEFSSGTLRGPPDYSQGAVFRVKVPAGTRVLDVQKTIPGQAKFGNEQERVLPRGGKFTVTAATPADGKKKPAVIDVVYTPPGPGEHGAQDAKREPEHRLVLEFNGDFDMAQFLRALHSLGSMGASRGIDVATDDPEMQRQMEDKGFRVRFGWDGDGADKIVSAELDGQNILAMDGFEESKHPRDASGKFGSGGEGGNKEVSSQSPHESEHAKFREAGTGNLKAQGFEPAKRSKGTDVTGALRVAWHQAGVTGKPQTLTHTGRGGLVLLRSGERIPPGQSHMVVYPNGDVKKYHPAMDANIPAQNSDWDESKHKRDHGKFSTMSGGSGGKSSGGTEHHAKMLAFLDGKLSPEALEHVKGLLSGGEKEAAPAKTKAIDPAKMKKVGEQMGSNPGGVFEDADGNRFYIKQGKTKDHVRNELIAASLYALAGSPTLEYVPVQGGDQIATKMSKLDKSRADQLSLEELKKAQEDFATHAWTANWDAAGLDYDNVGTVGGKPTSLDLGGAMEYRGMGAPKGEKFGNAAGEWDTMRNPSINPQNAKIFGKMTPEQLKRSAKKVASIPDDKIRAAIKQNGGSDALVAKMIARKNDIAQRAGI